MLQGAQTLSTKTNTQQSLPILLQHETKFQLLSNADILQRKSHIPPCDDKNNTEPSEIQCHFIKPTTYERTSCMCNENRELINVI